MYKKLRHWNTRRLPSFFFTINLFLKSMAFPLLKPPFLPSPLHKMHILTLAMVFRRTADPGVDDVAFRGVLAATASCALEGVVVATAAAGLALSVLSLFSAAAAFSLFSLGFLAGAGLDAFLAESSSLELSSPWKRFALKLKYSSYLRQYEQQAAYFF